MQKRQIGTTGMWVSVIGLGTVKFGRNQGVKYPQPFQLPTDDEIDRLLQIASELGINLLDTAPAYGSSEERLGKALLGKREQFILSTKVGEEFENGESLFDFSKAAIVASVERSLKRLRTDYLDVVLVHSNGDDIALIEQDEVFVTLEQLRAVGKLRAFGMSSKTLQGGRKTLELADLAMIAFNPDYQDEVVLIREAVQQQKGIFIKKAFASGHMAAHKALPFIFTEPGVTSVIVGTINTDHLRDNVLEANKILLASNV